MPPERHQRINRPFRGPRSMNPNPPPPVSPPRDETPPNEFDSPPYASAAPMLAQPIDEPDPVLDLEPESDSYEALLAQERRRLQRYQQKVEQVESRIKYLEERIAFRQYCFDHPENSHWISLEVHSDDIATIASDLGYQLLGELLMLSGGKPRHEKIIRNPAYKACVDRFLGLD